MNYNSYVIYKGFASERSENLEKLKISRKVSLLKEVKTSRN
jgi:hypothetical protein